MGFFFVKKQVGKKTLVWEERREVRLGPWHRLTGDRNGWMESEGVGVNLRSQAGHHWPQWALVPLEKDVPTVEGFVLLGRQFLRGKPFLAGTGLAWHQGTGGEDKRPWGQEKTRFWATR